MMRKQDSEQFDISRVPENGYLIFPLSMSRLTSAQSPESIYDFLEFFEEKLTKISVDVIFLYTNDLYLSVSGKAISIRNKLLNQMLNHKTSFMGIVLQRKKYVPQAFHFLPWDYATLNAEDFNKVRTQLMRIKNSDIGFRKVILQDITAAKREESDENINFVLEEVAISHLLSQKRIPLPHALASEEGWRLICYPGKPLHAWMYITQHKLLPFSKDLPKQHQKLAQSFYSIDAKQLISLT